MKIAYLTNASENSGVGRRASEIKKRLKESGVDEIRLKHTSRWPKTIDWIVLGRQLDLRGYDIVHATNQTLSFVLRQAQDKPRVVTVHDIIEVTEPQSFWGGRASRYLYSGISKAERVIAVSEYTKRAVQARYQVPDERMRVIYNGVGEEFFPIDNFRETIGCQELRRELKVPEGVKIVLYVGSDHPRKNVVGAVAAFAKSVVDKEINMIFIKVGKPGLPAGRNALLEEIDRLGIRERVRFVGNVDLERLNGLYNLADVLIYPSRFEGFGLPVLEAMAAGCPVLTSNATSIPEVVGDSAVRHDPDDIDGMAESLQRVLSDKAFADELVRKGRERAKLFSWDRAARAELEVYQSLAS